MDGLYTPSFILVCYWMQFGYAFAALLALCVVVCEFGSQHLLAVLMRARR